MAGVVVVEVAAAAAVAVAAVVVVVVDVADVLDEVVLALAAADVAASIWACRSAAAFDRSSRCPDRPNVLRPRPDRKPACCV